MPRAISRTVADHACPCHVPRARTLLPALAGLDTSYWRAQEEAWGWLQISENWRHHFSFCSYFWRLT